MTDHSNGCYKRTSRIMINIHRLTMIVDAMLILMRVENFTIENVCAKNDTVFEYS